MAKKEKVSLPPTGGGLFRTYDEEGKGLRFKPEHVIGMAVVVIIIEILLHFYGRAVF